jgi:hypothetical protein
MEIKELKAPPLIADLKLSAVIGVLANNRQVLLEHIRQNYPMSPSPILVVQMPCGGRVEYKTKADIPATSVPCPCGDPTHWLIKYVPSE